MEFACLSKYFDAVRTGYSVPRSLHGVDAYTSHPRGLPARACGYFRLKKQPILPQASALLQRPLKVLPISFRQPKSTSRGSRTEVRSPIGSSHEVLRPSNATSSSGRHIVQLPHRTPSLRGLSQTLEGLIPDQPDGLVSYRLRSWGSAPFKAFPSGSTTPELVAREFPSQRFSSGFVATSKLMLTTSLGRVLRALSLPESVPPRGVLQPRLGRCSPGLFRLRGYRSRLEPSLNGSSAHDLFTKSLQAHSPRGSSASSHATDDAPFS